MKKETKEDIDACIFITTVFVVIVMTIIIYLVWSKAA